ncbi:MAG: CoA transferase [Bryobacterales bacterium]|nr:CoA transferase [Bryobacterales bacterium]
MAKPLDGIRVLDFSHALAGPYCTMLMADYGAEVYKVEGVDTHDMGRTWGPPFQGGEASYFLGLNCGKRAVSVDLKDERGRELCLRMAEKTDVLIENFRPGAMARLGLSYEEVRVRNPRLIYCSISGYGQNGPSRDKAAMDLIVQASSGLMSVTGTADGQVARCGHSVADITAGMFALIGVLMAIQARERTGVGQFVDVSMLDSMISAMASSFAYYLGSGIIPRPLGTAFATIVPYAAFPAKDREIAIAVASERLWEAFCEAVEKPEWAADERFATNSLRVKHRGVLEPAIVEVFRQRTAEEWTEIFRQRGIPCTPVRNLKEVVEDPQAAARGMFPAVTHPAAGEVRVTGVPVKLSEMPGSVESAAPLVGQHTRETLRVLLGMKDSEIDELVRGRVILESA